MRKEHKNDEHKVSDIVQTASRMFQEKGYDNVSVQDICDEMGFTKPTFYHYIGSKDRILASYFEEVQKSIVEKVQALADQGKDMEALSYGLCSTQEVAERVGYKMYAVYIQYLLMVETSSYPYTRELQNLLISLIARLQKNKVIQNPSSPEQIYKTLIHLNQGLSISWCSVEGSFELRREFMQLATQVMGSTPEDMQAPEADRKKEASDS